MHPHDNYSIIRVAYTDPIEKSTIKGNLKECIEDAVILYNNLKKDFSRFAK
jgi:hypothetical protein